MGPDDRALGGDLPLLALLLSLLTAVISTPSWATTRKACQAMRRMRIRVRPPSPPDRCARAIDRQTNSPVALIIVEFRTLRSRPRLDVWAIASEFRTAFPPARMRPFTVIHSELAPPSSPRQICPAALMNAVRHAYTQPQASMFKEKETMETPALAFALRSRCVRTCDCHARAK